MNPLVWDDSRVDELADLVQTTVWRFLDQFDINVDTMEVAARAGAETRSALLTVLAWEEK